MDKDYLTFKPTQQQSETSVQNVMTNNENWNQHNFVLESF